MSPSQNNQEGGVQSEAERRDAQEYESPAIRLLGSLAELTQGGTTGPNDGFGGAGAQGSI